MAELKSKFETSHDYIWRCDCHDWHYLELAWDDEDPAWRWIDLVDTYWPRRFRDRFKAAWTVLRGKPHYARGIVLGEDTIKELVEVLTKHASEV